MLIIFQRLISLPHDTSIMGSLGPLVPSSRSFKEKEMAAHSSILTWRIPWTGEPGLAGYSPWGHKGFDTTERLSIVLYKLCWFS